MSYAASPKVDLGDREAGLHREYRPNNATPLEIRHREQRWERQQKDAAVNRSSKPYHVYKKSG
jgi:hypothetical protein